MEYYYDEDAGEFPIKFIETFCRHTKGELGGELLKLEDWQKNDIIRPLFGMKRKSDGLRKYRVCYLEVPRKNAKSTICAALGNFLLSMDNEFGAEIYSAAADKEQAGIVFNVAKTMVEFDPELSKIYGTFKNSITFEPTASSYKVISADADTKHGFNAHGVLFDELHTQTKRDLYDVLTTSVGSRRQPLTILITTAGYDRNSICYEMHDYALKVKKGIIEDEEFLPVIYAADPEDDIYSEDTWKKANPGYGTIVKKEYIASVAKKAKLSAQRENTFKRLHLNIWTSSEVKFIKDEIWMSDKNARTPTIPEGATIFGGLDLASTLDITALVFIYKELGEYHILPYFFIPEDTVPERVSRGIPYDQWIKDGYIFTTPGNVTDYNYIKAFIMELGETYNIEAIAYDRFNSSQLVIDLTEEGVEMEPYGQGFISMNAPTKEIEKLAHSNELRHGGNPVIRWMLDNVMLKQDPSGNIKMDKSKSTEKIDGMVALAMAIGCMLTAEPPKRSRYEDEGAEIGSINLG